MVASVKLRSIQDGAETLRGDQGLKRLMWNKEGEKKREGDQRGEHCRTYPSAL